MYPNNNEQSSSENICNWDATDEDSMTYTFCHQYLSQIDLFDTYDFRPKRASTNEACPSPSLPSPPSPIQDGEEDLHDFYLGSDSPKESDSTPGSCSKHLQDFGKIKNDQVNVTNDDLDYKIDLINITRHQSQNYGEFDDLFNDEIGSTTIGEKKELPAKSDTIQNGCQIICHESPLILRDADNLFDDNSLFLTDHDSHLDRSVTREDNIDPLLQHDFNMSPRGILLDSPDNFLMDRDVLVTPRFGSVNLGYESDGLFGDSGDHFLSGLFTLSGNSPTHLNSMDYPEIDSSNHFGYVNYVSNVDSNNTVEVDRSLSQEQTISSDGMVDQDDDSSIVSTPDQGSNFSRVPLYNYDDDSDDSSTSIILDNGSTKRKRQMKTNYDCRLCGQPRKYHICPYKLRKESDKQLNDRIRRECTTERQRKRVTRTRAGAPLKRYTCKKCGQYKKDDLGRSHICVVGNNSGTQVDQLMIYDKNMI